MRSRPDTYWQISVMASHSSELAALCECLRGTVPARTDWVSLIGLANETLVTPYLIDLVDRSDGRIPEDVCAYVRDIHRRNAIRNARLALQLDEAVAALNERGVTPVLLKGAAMLATAPHARRATKLMADLDILIAPDQVATAADALAELGYKVHFQTGKEKERQFTDFKRPRDVGMIDLHQSAPGPAYFYCASGPILEHCKLVTIGQATAYVPTATYRALILILHDQFQDYDYWVGNIDLRHLVELRDLAQSTEGIDWDQLASFVPSKLARNALESVLVALAELLGLDIPIHMRSRLIPRLQFIRRLTQARFPVTRWPLLVMVVLDYGNYRRGPGAQYRTTGQRVGGLWSTRR